MMLRLLSKNLFPYNIGPVYRLLDKVDNLHRSQKNSNIIYIVKSLIKATYNIPINS